jgi:hypothetical protein
MVQNDGAIETLARNNTQLFKQVGFQKGFMIQVSQIPSHYSSPNKNLPNTPSILLVLLL